CPRLLGPERHPPARRALCVAAAFREGLAGSQYRGCVSGADYCPALPALRRIHHGGTEVMEGKSKYCQRPGETRDNFKCSLPIFGTGSFYSVVSVPPWCISIACG